jgi:molybdopterin-containing oxidoreductase family membrane subunit
MSFREINDDILRTLSAPSRLYVASVVVLIAVLGWAGVALAYQYQTGLGVAGYRPPIQWAVYITNFVFWVGITHSGTLVSAVLFLLRARWRTGVARASEAMTVFALATAGLFPIIHLGRPWFFYWLIPYPNERQLWVNFRSPLVWDLFAIGTYFSVSVLFLYIGMIPDLAIVRDRQKGWRQVVYSVLALGWRGSDREWRHHQALYGFLAAIVIPLAVSVHSIVSWDFAMGILPGWHATIFAPYFVTGAIFSGVAMMLALLILLRRANRLEHYIPVDHLDHLGKLLLVTSLLLTYAYASEFFTAWYSGQVFERGTFLDRATGRYAPFFWIVLFCNSVFPLGLAFRSVRRNVTAVFVIAILALVGMYFERYVIIIQSLSRVFNPAVWPDSLYQPTWVEGAITAGSFALFLLLFVLFIKNFPSVSMAESKERISEDTAEAHAAVGELAAQRG